VRIAITATGPTLEDKVDPRFGRCPYFIIVNPETLDFEALENSSAMAAGGAGIATGQMIAEKGVEAVLTGNCGPNAHQVLSAAGLQVITGVSGIVKDAIEEYKLGTFSASQQPNVADHFGISYSSGGGGYVNTGHGTGRGRGMGMGRGMRGGIMPVSSGSPQPTPQQDIEILKTQSQALEQQLSEIQRQIEELEKEQK
jgi:predicted Fe-Mo cluster-binding NifX family protein